jgi:hypothetical protein
MLRQYDIDFDAPQRRQRESRNKSSVRQKVWSHDLHRCTGAANGYENQELDLFKILIRTGGYHPRHGLSGRLQDRKPRLTCKSLARTEQPIVRKHIYQLRNYRALHLKMSIEDWSARVAEHQVLCADVQTASEGHAAIHAKNFPVIPQIEKRHPPRQRRMQKPRRRHTSAPQPTKGGGTEIPTTKPID